MKKSRLILAASLLSLGAFSTVLTSCGKEDEPCNIGYTGSKCDEEVRESYANTYRGTATDNDGGTYTNWALRYSKSGTSATKMQLEVLDNANANVYLLTITLVSNTTYTVDAKSENGYEYSGQGSISGTNASLTLTEKDPNDATNTMVFSFNSFLKD